MPDTLTRRCQSNHTGQQKSAYAVSVCQRAPFLLTESVVRQQARWTKAADPGQPADESPAVDDRERLLIEAVVTLARSLRDERDRLAGRLREVENELQTLASRLEPGALDSSEVPAAE
jgi:hypothetical protein